MVEVEESQDWHHRFGCCGHGPLPMYCCRHFLLINTSVLQCGAGCCRVLQGVAGCCRVLQGVAGCCRVLQDVDGRSGLQCVGAYCSGLQWDAACCSKCYIVFHCLAVGCSGLQWVASGLQLNPRILVAMFRSHARHVMLHDMLDDLLHDVLPYF